MNHNTNPKRYVGARYVPIFTDLPNNEWQAGYSYERLTVVLYNGQGYTSKIFVPSTVGNPADNPDYWVLTSNYDIRTTNLEKNLTKEISDRKNADTTLQGNLNAEASTRANEDNKLQNSINDVNESLNNNVARLDQTDTTLQTAINENKTAIETEITNRSTNDTELESKITAETSAREQADAELEGKITAETSAREQADTELENKISTETSTREQADTELENKISTETSAREQVDKTFVTAVTITNENGIYTFKKTINNTESEIGTVEVPQNNPVVEIKDARLENNTDGYDYHTISETLASGTSNNVTELYLAKKQIVDISLDETGNNLVITTIDQTGTKETKTITIKEVA